MKIRVIAIVVFLLVVGGGLAVHFRQAAVVDRTDKEHANHGHPSKDEPEVPVPPKTGPFAKFVVEGDPIHTFGVMEHLQDGEHEFTVRNAGEGVLKMVALAKDHTCQCTLGSLGKEGLQPGESTTVTMTWKIKNPSTLFEHSAKIRTNDPKKPVTTFLVRGLVGKRLSLMPSSELVIGLLSEKEPTERSLTLHSEIVDSFQVSKIEISNPLITAEIKPLNAEQLISLAESHSDDEKRAMAERATAEAAKPPTDGVDQPRPEEIENPLIGKKPPAKCGYGLVLRFQPGFAIGKFRETATIHTDIRDGSQEDSSLIPPVVVSIQGHRAGPLEMFALGKNFGWFPEQNILSMGRFPAKEGKTVKLMVFISKGDEDLKIVDAQLDPPLLKCELVKDEKFQQPRREKYTLTVEVPGGNAPIGLGGERQGSVTLQTNHPDAKTIKFDVDFTSY